MMRRVMAAQTPGLIGGALALLQQVRWWELAFVPLV